MGYLTPHLTAWQRIGAPDFVQDWVQNGVPLDFLTVPPHLFGTNRVRTAKAKQFVTVETQRLCAAGHLLHTNQKPRCISLIQTTPKKSGGFRLVTDCRPVNKFLRVPSFSQGGIKEVVALIQPCDKLATIDLKDSFFHIGVQKEFTKFLGIKWQGQYYCWQVLPFGLAVSPFYFHKVLQPVKDFLTKQGLRLALWVDDWLHMVEPCLAVAQQELLLDTFSDLGWRVNFKKSQLRFCETAVFVSYQIWSNFDGIPWIRTLPQKIHKLCNLIRSLLNKGCVHARRVASVTGQCVAMIKAFAPGQLQLRNLYRDLSMRCSWDDLIQISLASRADLQWWLSALTGWNGAPLCQKLVDIQVVTDASNIGWGGCINDSNEECSGAWGPETSTLHINTKELLAVFLTLKSLRS